MHSSNITFFGGREKKSHSLLSDTHSLLTLLSNYLSSLSSNVGGPVVSVLTVTVAPSVGLTVGTSGKTSVGIGVSPPAVGIGEYVGTGVPGPGGVGGVGIGSIGMIGRGVGGGVVSGLMSEVGGGVESGLI